MHKVLLWILCGMLIVGCSGCSMALQPEHQAYIISMGIDSVSDGQIEVSVQFPTIGASDSQSGSESQKNSGYLIASATGMSFGEAMDLLRATLPRNMQLSQMKSIVVSDTIAQSDRFHTLIDDLTMTYQLYGAATVIVCLGSAKDFIKAQTPVVGARLSTSVTAELEHYNHQGYMPKTTLNQLYSSMHSIYSTSILTLAATAQDNPQPMTPGRLGEALPGTLNRDGENKNEYMGCALIDRSGRMVGKLNGLLTQWLEILCEDVQTVSYMCDGLLIGLKTTQIRVDIDLDAQPMHIHVALSMVSRPLNGQPSFDTLSRTISRDLAQLVQACQDMGVEPFRWSQSAARKFATIESYQAYDFITQYRRANVTYDVRIENP